MLKDYIVEKLPSTIIARVASIAITEVVINLLKTLLI